MKVTTRSESDRDHRMPSKDVRTTVDEVDRILLRELAADARTPNNALAAKAGVAPSTALGRVRGLVEDGVLRGTHADIDPALTGRPLQAMVAVRMRAHARSRLTKFLHHLADLPGVRNVYLLGGTHDFMIHLAVPDTNALNDFVIEHLSAIPDVASTETSLIFQHVQSHRFD